MVNNMAASTINSDLRIERDEYRDAYQEIKGKYEKLKVDIKKHQKPTILGISEVSFINNIKFTNVFNAEWKIHNKENVIRHLIGKIKKIDTPFKISIKIDILEDQ